MAQGKTDGVEWESAYVGASKFWITAEYLKYRTPICHNKLYLHDYDELNDSYLVSEVDPKETNPMNPEGRVVNKDRDPYQGMKKP